VVYRSGFYETSVASGVLEVFNAARRQYTVGDSVAFGPDELDFLAFGPAFRADGTALEGSELVHDG